VAGPFKVVTQPYVLKDANRKPIITGQQIVPVTATVRTGTIGLMAGSLTDGQGILQRDSDPLLEHDTDPNHMYLSHEGLRIDAIEFDLGQEVPLDLMLVWNYNLPELTGLGVRQADISVWTEQSGWRRYRQQVRFARAEGTDDYDEPTGVRFEGLVASKVRLEGLIAFDGSGRLGLAEVQFFRTRTAKAIRPMPVDGGRLRQGQDTLQWVPGAGLMAQRLYLGLDPNRMQPLGELAADAFAVVLDGLCNGQRYYWRVDGVRKDGTVVASDTWSFDYGGLVAWYRFDQTSGDLAPDSSGHGLDARVFGGPEWRPDGGKVGGALSLDGKEAHVVLPADVGSGSGGLTIAIWLYPQDIARSACLVEFGPSSPIYIDAVGQQIHLYISQQGYSDLLLRTPGALRAKTWQLIVGTIDHRGRAILYKDGKPVAVREGVPIPDVARTSNLIGRSVEGRRESFCGMIDELRVYGHALDEQEVAALYEGRPLPVGPETPANIPKIVRSERHGQEGIR